MNRNWFHPGLCVAFFGALGSVAAFGVTSHDESASGDINSGGIPTFNIVAPDVYVFTGSHVTPDDPSDYWNISLDPGLTIDGVRWQYTANGIGTRSLFTINEPLAYLLYHETLITGQEDITDGPFGFITPTYPLTSTSYQISIVAGKTFPDAPWTVTLTIGGSVTPTCNDNDVDGYGSPGDPSCSAGPETDCNDGNANIHPGAAEVLCNGVDENCNGNDDDDSNADGDPVSFCDGDCDDNDPERFPGNAEIVCNGIDENCNGGADDEPDPNADGVSSCRDNHHNDRNHCHHGNNHGSDDESDDDSDDDSDDAFDVKDGRPLEVASRRGADREGCIDGFDELMNLLDDLPSEIIAHQVRSSLKAKIRAAEKSASRGNLRAAANSLKAFKSEVIAHRGNKIDDEIADVLLDYADAFMTAFDESAAMSESGELDTLGMSGKSGAAAQILSSDVGCGAFSVATIIPLVFGTFFLHTSRRSGRRCSGR